MTSKQFLLVPLLVAIAVGLLLLFLDSGPPVVDLYPETGSDPPREGQTPDSGAPTLPLSSDTAQKNGSPRGDPPPATGPDVGKMVVVTGVVFDRDRPVEGASVYAVLGRGNLKPGTKMVSTGTAGRFRLQLPARSGNWSLVAQAPGYLRTISDQFSVQLDPIIIDLDLELGLTIAGHVSNTHGHPVAGMEIFASLIDRNMSDAQPWRVRTVLDSSENSLRFGRGIGGLAITDERGRFEIVGLQPAQYHLSSISVDYALDHPILVGGGDANLELLATERNWVVIEGYSSVDGVPIPGFTATVRFEILFEDGTKRDRGQSVGTGDGTIEMFLHRSIFSPTARQGKVIQVTPYGEAEAIGFTNVSFEGTPIRAPSGGCQIEVVLDPLPKED